MDISHEIVYYGSCPIYYIRCGNIVTITCNDGVASFTADVENFRIPSKYVPYQNVDFRLRSPDSAAIIINNGVFMPLFSGENIPLRFTISYIAAPL